MESRKILAIYKAILRLHRGLPPELRVLGDQYVRGEFRSLRNAKPEHLNAFIKEWVNYTLHLSRQLDLRTSETEKVGLPLTANQLDDFQEEQLRQLHELQKAAVKTYNSSPDEVVK